MRKTVFLSGRKKEVSGLIRRAEGTVYRYVLHKAKPLCEDSLVRLSSSLFSRPVVILMICAYGGSFFAFSFSPVPGILFSLSMLLFLVTVSRFSASGDQQHRLKILITLVLGAVVACYCFTYVFYRKSAADSCLMESGTYHRSIYDEFTGVIQSVETSGSGYQTFVMQMDHGALVTFGGMDVSAGTGDRISVLGRMKRIESSNNPGAFNRYDYYSRKGIFIEISTYDSCIQVLVKGPGTRSFWEFLLSAGTSLREGLREAIELVLPEEDSGLLIAMLLGDTSNVSRDLKSDFRLLNLSHLTAVSGANIAFFLIPASGAVRIVTGRRRLRGVILILFLVSLGFLTGWSASVSRAILVSGTHIVSDLSAKRHCPICAVCTASCLLIFLDPFSAVDIGFNLSAGASISLILFSDPAVSLLTRMGLKPNIASFICPAICAQIGMLPWMIHLSGRESIFLLAVNILGSILAEGISIFGMMAIPSLLFPYLFDTLWPARLFFAPVRGLLFLLTELTERSVRMGIHAFRLQTASPILLIAIAGLFIVLLLRQSYVKKILGLIVIFGLCTGVVLQVFSQSDQALATVIFSDVGQGDSCLILLEDGKSILIDAGTEEEGERTLLPMMNYFGIDTIDVCILTHLHQDHGGGYIPLVREDRVSSIFTPVRTAGSELSELFILCEKKNVQIHTLKKDDRIVLTDNLMIDVLLPCEITENGGNADSAVLFLDFSGTGILMMGDSGFDQEILLNENSISTRLSQDTDIVKIGHHGSKYSTGYDFLSMICAETAIISVGENGYGHPSEETLGRLDENRVMTFRTDWSGAVILQIFDDQYQVSTCLCS